MDVFQLWGQIAIDNAQANSAIDGTTKKASTFGEVLKANLASEAIISGVKKLASVVVDVGKAAYESYAEYEQLAGGAELMFGDAYDTVAQNAKKAYKTVQMSQNEYLTQVNGLATGLKTALGGNEQAAADLAHKIIVAEADVVAATGNTQEAVQNAFNGIMKSNYTMLDNLQLGITPTKEGFQEIIDKVNEWNAAQGNATNYTIDNLADAQAALVDYIEMQGLAGYAASEAADTIQGSTASMKAAWSNLATGMADETADMEQLTQDFVDSVGVAAKNILPRVQQILTGVGTATVEGIAYLRETNAAIDLVVTVLEDVAVAAGGAGAALIAIKVGNNISNIATIFKANAEALAFFTVESGKAAIAEATLNGTFSVGEIVVGVLTGKISLATAAQYAWNTAMNANPIGIVIAAVSALGIVLKKAYDYQEDHAQQLAETDGTISELAKRYDELRQGYENYQERLKNNQLNSPIEYSEMAAIKKAMEEVENQLNELIGTEQTAALISGEITEQTLADAEAIQTAAETYSESVQAIIEDYYSTYQSIYDGLHKTGSVFMEITEATEIAWADAMKNIDQNTQFLERMDSNLAYVSQAADDAGINIDGFKQILSTMSDSDAAGLVASLAGELEKVGPSSKEAVTTLENLSLATARYSDSGLESADIMAKAVEEVDERIKEATENYEAAVKDLDKGAEAIEAGQNTMEGLASGIVSSTPNVLSKIDSLASQMKSRLTTSFAGFTLNIQALVSTSKDGSHKDGLDYVPYDGYISELHKGEAVLTASEARAWRAGKAAAASSGTSESGDGGRKETSHGVTIVQYIQAVAQTPVELAAATESYFTQARWSV